MKKIVTGNFNEEGTETRGWVTGHFISGDSPLQINDFELKWGKHKAGDEKSAIAVNKSAKTLAILVYGEIQIDFPSENESIILSKEGDYLYLPPKISHTWKVLKDMLLITVRWPSLPDDQVVV